MNPETTRHPGGMEGGATHDYPDLVNEVDETSVPEHAPTPQGWPTRAALLDNATGSKKPLIVLGSGLGLALTFFAITTMVGKPAHKRVTTVPAIPASTKPNGSVTPLMDTVRSPASNNIDGQLTAADINHTKAAEMPHSISATSGPGTTSIPTSATTLASVPPFESTQQHWEDAKPFVEAQKTTTPPTQPVQQNFLKEPSLVFVRKAEQSPGSGAIPASGIDNSPRLELTPGTRIQARLETQVSTAVSAPVVAIVEYTYALQDRVVIPAGARVYGQLQQADKSGAIGIKFTEIQLLDGKHETIDAIGTSLELGPIKGIVSGKNTGRNFLVRTASGIGSIAAMVVGNNTSSAFSADDLIRQRIAENVGNAGDMEIMNMNLTNRIVVSVPADTPIYVIFTKRSESPVTLRSSATP